MFYILFLILCEIYLIIYSANYYLTKKSKHISVQDRSGLFFVVKRENKGCNCKRFEGITNYPNGRGGKTVHVPMGVLGKDIKGVKDLNKTLRT